MYDKEAQVTFVVTGRPGTGKSTAIRTMLDSLKKDFEVSHVQEMHGKGKHTVEATLKLKD